MPELAKTSGYRLPQLSYQPRAFDFDAPPPLVPDMGAALALGGSTATMGIVAKTLAELPKVISDSYAAGQKQTEQEAGHKLKMGALAGGLSDNLSIGADNSVSIKPVDPYSQEIKNQGALANIALANAKRAEIARRANAPDATAGLFEDDDEPGAAPQNTLAEPAIPGAASDAPLTGGGALGERPRPPETPLRAEVDGLGNPVIVKPQGALATGPVVGDLPQKDGAATPAAPSMTDVPGERPLPPIPGVLEGEVSNDPTSLQGTRFQKGNRAAGRPAQWFDRQTGDLVAMLAPGMKTPHFMPRKAAPAATPEAAAAKASAVTEANELIKRGHSAAEVAAMTDAEKQAELGKPKPVAEHPVTARQLGEAGKYGLDVDLTGKTGAQAQVAITEAMRKKGYELAPAQLAQYNTMVSQMARNPILKTAGVANVGFEAVMSGYRQKNGIGDISMVDGLMRLVNPSMGVTAHAADSVQQGIPTIERLTGLAIDKIFNGDQLTPEARDKIVAQAKDLRQAENLKRKAAIDAYLHQAQMDGLTPAQVDRAEKDALAMFAMGESEPAAVPAPGAPGTVTIIKNGHIGSIPAEKLAEFEAKGWVRQ